MKRGEHSVGVLFQNKALKGVSELVSYPETCAIKKSQETLKSGPPFPETGESVEKKKSHSGIINMLRVYRYAINPFCPGLGIWFLFVKSKNLLLFILHVSTAVAREEGKSG
ncbi:hypothetical protein XELAEV_18013747mg [Xenopus laevis]|uniref:Uncharacterized protein n=1 Tax=Xenopus laevis TaxID=8355 RepID=A0A974HZQ7_XENLA|nr:hypothetical protein XELAEV_18013747mg [Xenopus laevis]